MDIPLTDIHLSGPAIFILIDVTNELHEFLLNLLVKSHLFSQIFDISKSKTSWLKIALRHKLF